MSDLSKRRTLPETLSMNVGQGIIAGTHEHECQGDDIIDVIGGQQCKICHMYVDNPEND